MSTPIGTMTRNAMPASRAWFLTFVSYSVRAMVSAFGEKWLGRVVGPGRKSSRCAGRMVGNIMVEL